MHAALTELYYLRLNIILTRRQQSMNTTTHCLHYVMMVFYYVQTFLVDTHFFVESPHLMSLISLRFLVCPFASLEIKAG